MPKLLTIRYVDNVAIDSRGMGDTPEYEQRSGK